ARGGAREARLAALGAAVRRAAGDFRALAAEIHRGDLHLEAQGGALALRLRGERRVEVRARHLEGEAMPGAGLLGEVEFRVLAFAVEYRAVLELEIARHH